MYFRVRYAALGGRDLRLRLRSLRDQLLEPELGLAERAVTADQSLWPLIVVVSVLVARARPALTPERASAMRSR